MFDAGKMPGTLSGPLSGGAVSVSVRDFMRYVAGRAGFPAK